MTGHRLSGFDPELIADAGGDVVAEPVGCPAWDVELLASDGGERCACSIINELAEARAPSKPASG